MNNSIMQTVWFPTVDNLYKDLDPCRIFLVEDDLDDMACSKRELEASSHIEEVKCFSDGEDLMSYMTSQGFQDHTVMCMTPTIIVIDLNMPRMDGLRVLEQLKSDWFLGDIPVADVTGETSYKTMRHVLDLASRRRISQAHKYQHDKAIPQSGMAMANSGDVVISK